jgi:ubiquinone/menaquinone biosynthesis C-methylase UbiE
MEAGFQKSVWLNGAGDDWFQRNKDKLGERDLASDAIEAIKITPEKVLEIGCANGWRLKKLQEKYECMVWGLEPSAEARREAQIGGLNVYSGTADDLSGFKDNSVDTVIFGFCLCFISPEDWLATVKESDRVLKDEGHIIIYDFVGTRFLKRRMMNITTDKSLEEKPLYLYNFDWPQLWLSHPSYKTAVELFDLTKSEVCTVLHKGLHYLLDDNIRTT